MINNVVRDSTTMSEKQFQTHVIQLATLLGWACWHCHDSRRSAAGFPDLVFVKAGRAVIYAELKTETGKVRPEQQLWIDLLEKAEGCRVYLWRPSDLQAIANVLRG